MMEVRVIRIRNCFECPYVQKDESGKYYCGPWGKDLEDMKEIQEGRIPKRCSLPKEETEDE
jgi:hypothetical protein